MKHSIKEIPFSDQKIMGKWTNKTNGIANEVEQITKFNFQSYKEFDWCARWDNESNSYKKQSPSTTYREITKYFFENRDVLNISEIERQSGLKRDTLNKALKRISEGKQKGFTKANKLISIYLRLVSSDCL